MGGDLSHAYNVAVSSMYNQTRVYTAPTSTDTIASFPGHSQILSHSREEKSGEVLGTLLRHELEMVD